MENEISRELGNVLIVGGGRMGQAIARGMLRIEGMRAESIVIANPGAAKRAQITADLGIRCVEFADQGLPARTIIIAVKPHQVPDVAAALVAGGVGMGTRIVSVAAGISTSRLSEMIGNQLPIIRVMPNTPLVCGQGMSAVSGGATASAQDCELVRALFASMGRAIVVEEGQQDAVCAVSGSGPAYFELFCEIISRAADDLGLPYEVALELVLQTMRGTAALIQETGQSLPDAIDAVSSPGGTTVAALDAMHAHGIDEALAAAVSAAARRSKELGA